MTGCSDSSVSSIKPVCEEIPEIYARLPGNLLCEDETWTRDTTVAGPHIVLPGVTLTVEEGVTVTFTYHNGNPADVGTIITLPADDQRFAAPRPTAKLIAEGTAENPVVFTSDRKEINSWGGITMVGRARNNIPGETGSIEGLEEVVQYGGRNDADNSGILRYVRIEYAGFSIAEGSELQSLSLYSVGRQTTIDHVNIFESSDDGVELFGGTVDFRYIVVYGAADDSFDFDQGWQGRGQFWLGVQESGADNGFEADGCAELFKCQGGNGPTAPRISNVTLVGAGNIQKTNHGLLFRENLEGQYANIILTGFDGYHWLLEGQNGGTDGGSQMNDDRDNTFENYGSTLQLLNVVLQDNNGWELDDHRRRYISSYTLADSDDPAQIFTDPERYDFSLPAGSVYLSGGQVPEDSWFEDVSFRGAFGTENWVRSGSWVRWPQKLGWHA